MRILQATFRHFRGFSELVLKPQGHVALFGQPGAGRSDVIVGLVKVLSPDSTRNRTATELDFFKQDTSTRVEVEVVIGDLGPTFEQIFLDHLEVWEPATGQLVEELPDPVELDREVYELVVRLCYRAKWNESEEVAEHWVDYPKTSDAESGVFDRVGRKEREALPFSAVHVRGGIMDLGARGAFRRLVEQSAGGDFKTALDAMADRLETAASEFSGGQQVGHALDAVVAPLRSPMALPRALRAPDAITFLPEGGSLTGLVRSLAPSLDVGDGRGRLPLNRHGSTVEAMVGVAEALAAAGKDGIVVADDFGEHLDSASAQHIASVLRRSAGQAWLSTRRAAVAEVFPVHELVRLAPVGPDRVAFYGRNPVSRAERTAARHLTIQLFPALAAAAVAVVEGPHDRAAYTAVALKRFEELNVELPAATRITFADAAAVEGSGGSSAVPRLTRAARELGLFTVAIIDQDAPGQQGDAELHECLHAADAVIRLPQRTAIELALMDGVEDATIRDVVSELSRQFEFALPRGFEALQGNGLRSAAILLLKKQNLHAQFVQALPSGVLPQLATRVLDTLVSVVSERRTGLAQL